MKHNLEGIQIGQIEVGTEILDDNGDSPSIGGGQSYNVTCLLCNRNYIASSFYLNMLRKNIENENITLAQTGCYKCQAPRRNDSKIAKLQAKIDALRKTGA